MTTIICEDITNATTDAIVNSANKSLIAGSGSCGAIFRKAGKIELEKECVEIRKRLSTKWLPIGDVIVTKPYNLLCKHIIHTVAPKYYFEDSSLLEVAITNSLQMAESLNCKSIAFPPIATGINGFPVKHVAQTCKRVFEKSELDIYVYISNNESFVEFKQHYYS